MFLLSLVMYCFIFHLLLNPDSLKTKMFVGRQQPPQQQQQPQRPNYNVGGFTSPGPHKPAANASVFGARDDRGVHKNFGQ